MSQKFAAKVLTFYEMGNTRFTEYLHLIDNHPGIANLIALAELLVDMLMERIHVHLILPYPGENL